MSLGGDFAARVFQSEDGARVRLDQIWRRFLEWKPELAASPNKRPELARCISAAAADGGLILPVGKALYDRSAVPILPLWVGRPEAPDPSPAGPRFDFKAFPWCEALSFVPGLARLSQPADALAINRYLVEHKDLVAVPTKERSYAIFGDEKRLHAVLDGVLGTPQLLEKLKIFDPMLVPVHRTFDSATARVLIVENEAAFDSFCRWNATHRLWAAVIFGRGIEIWKTTDFLSVSWATKSRFEYFGDFDQEGVCIAHHLATRMGADRAVHPLVPAYHHLAQQTPRLDPKTHTAAWPDAIAWLKDEALITRARDLFARNERVAQEAFGWTELRSMPAAFFG